VGTLDSVQIARMREANQRFTAAIAAADAAAALQADDDLHAVLVEAAGNAAVVAVLDQFGPVLRRAERMRFHDDGGASAERHERLIALCEAGDVDAAAQVAFDTWYSLPVD
jgi:DNA-binding GntR family transcriptional regulator